VLITGTTGSRPPSSLVRTLLPLPSQIVTSSSAEASCRRIIAESSRNAKRGREGSPDSPAKKAKAPLALPSEDEDEVLYLAPKILAKEAAKEKKAAAAAAKPKAARVPKAKKMYIPTKGSGAYAILIAMYKIGPEERVFQADIVEVAEDGGWSNTSFKDRSATKFHTAWNG
jgi:hypothetical protein